MWRSPAGKGLLDRFVGAGAVEAALHRDTTCFAAFLHTESECVPAYPHACIRTCLLPTYIYIAAQVRTYMHTYFTHVHGPTHPRHKFANLWHPRRLVCFLHFQLRTVSFPASTCAIYKFTPCVSPGCLSYPCCRLPPLCGPDSFWCCLYACGVGAGAGARITFTTPWSTIVRSSMGVARGSKDGKHDLIF